LLSDAVVDGVTVTESDGETVTDMDLVDEKLAEKDTVTVMLCDFVVADAVALTV
jgi:hypothetical protein